MEVAAFHPHGLTPCDSSLWPCSSRRRAGSLARIPLCGARTFLCSLRCSGCLADSRAHFSARVQRVRRSQSPIYVRAKIALVGVELRLAATRTSPDSRTRAAGAGRAASCRARRSQSAACASRSRAGSAKMTLQVMPGCGAERLLQHRVPDHDDAQVAVALEKQLASSAPRARGSATVVAADGDRAAFVEDRQHVAQSAAPAAASAAPGSRRRASR